MKNESYERNSWVGLEDLDEQGQERVSNLGKLGDEPDEPELVASGMPAFEELELDDVVRLA